MRKKICVLLLLTVFATTGSTMAQPTLPEVIDSRTKDLIERGYNDGTIDSVAPDRTVAAVRHHGSSKLITNIMFTDQIANEHRVAGRRCKMGVYGSKIVIIATLPPSARPGDIFASTTILPEVPDNFALVAHSDGCYCSWDSVPGAAYYEICSDSTAAGSSPVQRASSDATSVTIPYSITTDTYFAVRAVSYAGYTGDLSVFLTDSTAPPTPGGFSTASQIGSVLLQVDLGTDTAHLAVGFKEFIGYRAGDISGGGSTEIGRFSDSTWLYEMEMGTEAYFAISAIDWAGNESAKCSWTLGQSLRENALQDDFATYGGDEVAQVASLGLWWLKVADFEEDETWVGSYSSPDVVHYVAGTQGLLFDGMPASSFVFAYLEYSPTKDYSADLRFTDDDFIYITVYISSVPANYAYMGIQIRTSSANYFHKYWIKDDWSVGWNYWKIKKSDMGVIGSPDWSVIDRLAVMVSTGDNGADPFEITVDDWRIVKADPDDAAVGNDTGEAWDFSGGEWHVYGPSEAGVDVPYSLGQIKDAGGSTEYVAAYTSKEFNSAGDGFRYIGRVRAFKADGKAGLAWSIQTMTEGSEDLYVVYLDTSDDSIHLQKAVAGTYGDLATAVDFTSAPDAWYWIGIHHKGNAIKVYVSDGPAVFQAVNLKFSVTDTTYTQGRVGVWTEDSKARFTDLQAGSPDFAYSTYLAMVMKEGAGYGQADFVCATETQGQRLEDWFSSGAIVLWDNSDVCPTGYTRVAGADNRVLYAVAAGAGGVAGTSTHFHYMHNEGLYTNRLMGQWVGWGETADRMHHWSTGGEKSYYILDRYTDSQSHLYLAYKVLV